MTFNRDADLRLLPRRDLHLLTIHLDPVQLDLDSMLADGDRDLRWTFAAGPFDGSDLAIDADHGMFRQARKDEVAFLGLDLEDTGRPPDDQPQQQHETNGQRGT